MLPALAALLVVLPTEAQRWTLGETPSDGIVWQPGNDLPHQDHIEMSGEQMAFVLRWGIDIQGAFAAERSLVFPMLRTLPNDTHASLMYRMATDIPAMLGIDGLTLKNERVKEVGINGALCVRSIWELGRNNIGSARTTVPEPAVEMTRTIFPSTTLPLMCEHYTVRNITQRPIELFVPQFSQVVATSPEKGVEGSYLIRADLTGCGTRTLEPGAETSFDAIFQALRASEHPLAPDVTEEYARRMAFVHGTVDANLVLETPDPFIDCAFRFAKLRASESIFRTKGGYMHGPGGESYYAAIWANDQAEYVNPFFPYLGYATGNASALNSFRHFARFMNPAYKPLPSSIIAEGTAIWNGAGDRGDAAMIASGAARYVLARGSEKEAEELWPLIDWCLEYCDRMLTDAGVVRSDTDELEGRFPAGDANLCTSTLYYDGLLSAAALCRDLGRGAMAKGYLARARRLAESIERYFGADLGGYRTYRYYAGNTLLRSWICMPLITDLGSPERRRGTVDALTGPELSTDDGLLTEQGSTTFWDRSTLYALRGIFRAGYPDRALQRLHAYSERRLTGDHVPYPIEAWPEGSQRHLSAESGLYCRIVTEGLFGIRPTGLHSFEMRPSMPSSWERMALRRVMAFGAEFDIVVTREPHDRIRVEITPSQGGKSRIYHLTSTRNTIRVIL